MGMTPEQLIKHFETLDFRGVEKLAHAGVREAQYVLAYMCREGSPAEDLRKRVFWLAQAALPHPAEGILAKTEAGHYEFKTEPPRPGVVQAQLELGDCYMSGKGVPEEARDNSLFLRETAIYWYLEAAQQKLPEAFERLALIYAHDSDVPENYGKAVAMCREAITLGRIDTIQHLREIHYDYARNFSGDLQFQFAEYQRQLLGDPTAANGLAGLLARAVTPPAPPAKLHNLARREITLRDRHTRIILDECPKFLDDNNYVNALIDLLRNHDTTFKTARDDGIMLFHQADLGRHVTIKLAP